MNDNKKLIISIICSLIVLIGGTYAAWTFLTEKTDVTMLVDGDQISFNAGESITVDGILPVYTMEEGITKDIEIYKENGDYTAGIDLYLKLTSWSTAFASSSFRWALYKNGNYLSSGDFSSTKQNDSVKLTSNIQKINLTPDSYKLYLWIDAYQESNINMMNNKFTVSLYGKTTFYDRDEVAFEESTPNPPELADSMIPIRYNYVIDEWEKADSTNANNNWYDYYNKMWANAVLVTSDSRDRYMNADEGTTVNEDDILAYYVWIPRYKYLLFNVDSEKSSPQEIQIVFEKTTVPISNGDENGEYLSHPAFWWDNNCDKERPADGSEELSGIWVGKFETSGMIDYPKVKPNEIALVSILISQSFTTSRNIQTTAYLTEKGVNEIDAHMIKNIEWGAIAYLSHSRYGINKAIKSNASIITGRQGNYTYNDYVISNNAITLNKETGTGVLASTTGNVYGIYDMSGGAYDYVMSFRKTSASDDSPYFSNSGFSAATFPQSKYYDLYPLVTSGNDYTKRILGDATGETAGWYGSGGSFLNSGRPFMERGGSSHIGSLGIFHFADSGTANFSSRATLRSIIILP